MWTCAARTTPCKAVNIIEGERGRYVIRNVIVVYALADLRTAANDLRTSMRACEIISIETLQDHHVGNPRRTCFFKIMTLKRSKSDSFRLV